MDTNQCLLAAPGWDATSATMEQFVRQANALYSLPAVAAAVLELTDRPEVDIEALKGCIEQDPALTVRILRVVNSSLFGLSHPVGNLNQAITLLGIKPLKLLVLGFSLPESLFANLARQQLEWYWSTTLVRAVAAREISLQWFDRDGDDAFLAGLLQEIGILALIGQFREAYTRILSRTIQDEVDLLEIETQSLGFNHLALSAALLERWNMPSQLSRAIANLCRGEPHASGETATDHLTRVLQLATLLGDLVGRHRLSVLPKLLELGEAYCDLDKKRLNELVADLQPKVEQLAEVLSLDLPQDRQYTEILLAAHAQISALVVTECGARYPAEASEFTVSPQLQREAHRLQRAVKAFLQGPSLYRADTLERSVTASPDKCQHNLDWECSGEPLAIDKTFHQRLVLALGKCRAHRQPLSVIMLEVALDPPADASEELLMSKLLDVACRNESSPPGEMEASSSTRRTLVLPACDRQEAVSAAKRISQSIEGSIQRHAAPDLRGRPLVRAGVASVVLPAKNFEASRLLQTAERCLAAARTCGTSTVKSLEIY